MKLIFIIFFIFINNSFSKLDNNTIIISLSSNINSIYYTHQVINSILEQNIDQSLYKIILFLSNKEFKNKLSIPKEILFLEKSNKIRIIMIENVLYLQYILIYSINEYPKNPILIINDNIIFPEGWLEMFINDHKKYPNDIISASIQYYFGHNLNIVEFSDGFIGKKFGVFNHITNMIFNFGIINPNLGGLLYPPETFKNKKFYDLNLFLKINKNADEIWQSFFIMMENKILRQTSKIFDYTEYLINNNILNNKLKKFEKIKKYYMKYFPYFKKIVELRQKKIIVSFTSYYKRFSYIPFVIESIRNQTLFPNKIILIIFKNDSININLNLTKVELIKVNENIKSHKKYFYTMMKYRDYAVVTLDDDIYYTSDTIKGLYESYIKHPNIISGRRTHLIRYKMNMEIDKYCNWIFEQKNITSPDYHIFITTGAGSLYPPDILNIEEENKHIINEVLTTDDIFLKHLEIIKGIESIWVPNKEMLGLKSPNISSQLTPDSLFYNNVFINDINLNKLNIDISNEIIKNACIQYKSIKTGLVIHLFNLYNINPKSDKLTIFNIDAYSYCPINNNIKFQIYFGKSVANCLFNKSYSIVVYNSTKYKTKKILQAICSINKGISNFDDFLFPLVKSKDTLNIQIYNKRKYVCIIYKDFFCFNYHKCFLIALFYKNIKKGYEIIINISILNCI